MRTRTLRAALGACLTLALIGAPLSAAQAAPAADAGATPASVDLTRWAVTPGQQGSLDSCVSWVTGYAMTGWWAKRAGYSTTSFAPLYLYSQNHVDNSATGGGANITSVYNTLQTQGVAPQAAYSRAATDFKTQPTTAERNAAAPYKTSAYHTLFTTTNTQGGIGASVQPALKSALAAGYPVGVLVPSYDAFRKLDASHYVLKQSDAGVETGYKGGHYVLALGYDAEGLVVQNSWGTDWGRGGFAKLSWDFVAKHAIEADYIEGIAAAIPAAKRKAPSADMLLEAISASTTSLQVHWYAPSNSGTTAVSSYTLTVSGGTNVTRTYAASAPGYSVTFNGFKPNTSYTYTLTATNADGLSATTSATFVTPGANSWTKAPTVRAVVNATGLTPDPSVPTSAPVLAAAQPAPTTSAKPAVSPAPVIGKGTAGKAAIVWRSPLLKSATTTGVNVAWRPATVTGGKIVKYTAALTQGAKKLQVRTYATKAWHAKFNRLAPRTTYTVKLTATASTGRTLSRVITVRTH